MMGHEDMLEAFLRESNAIEDVWDEDSFEQSKLAWEFLNGKPITPETIKECHGILTAHLLPKEESGDFRKCAVWIGGHEGRPWYALPVLVENWCQSFPTLKDKDVFENEKLLQERHVQFERIHPFVDGNGRIGRILYNQERIRNGLLIHIIYEDHKDDYYKWFQKY